MPTRIAAWLIRSERLAHGWSQAGLCRGLCAVSYLSKIEQGKARADRALLRLLFERLDLVWLDEAQLAEARRQAEAFYEALFSADETALLAAGQGLLSREAELRHSLLAPDAALAAAWQRGEPLPEALEPLLDKRQLALQRLLQGREEDALSLWPCAYFHWALGTALYHRGPGYMRALEHLQEGYRLAAAEGRAHLMLLCRSYMGNCYANVVDVENMRRHYAVATRLAQALGKQELLASLRYNAACVQLEAGQCEEAYTLFRSLERQDALALHKLAICCEKLGRREEALSVLDRADAACVAEPDAAPLVPEMCALVRLRLERSDYLQRPEYGRRLLALFAACREQLPIGYAAFHLPWVLEWYRAARQYKQASELLAEFPVHSVIS